jgi:hypothetical protein
VLGSERTPDIEKALIEFPAEDREYYGEAIELLCHLQTHNIASKK